MAGSEVDYDGDGDLEEGIYYEMEGIRELLYQAIQSYAGDVGGTAIAYESIEDVIGDVSAMLRP